MLKGWHLSSYFLMPGAESGVAQGMHHFTCFCFGQAQHKITPSYVAMQTSMLESLEETPRVIKLVECGSMHGLPFLITKPFGRHLEFNDNAQLIVSVIDGAAAVIQQLASRTTPILHIDISVGNLIYYDEPPITYLVEFGTAVRAPGGHYLPLSPNNITGTRAFMARDVLQCKGYTVSSELESLMYVAVFLALSGVVRWAKSSNRSALAFKTESFCDQENFEQHVLRRCRKDLVVVVQRLQDLFWKPTYQRNVTALQFQQALHSQ